MTGARRIPHPLGGSTAGNWMRTLTRYRSRNLKWGRVAGISALVAAGVPFRMYERLRWNRKLSAVEVRDPIFICGHWQSGHTLAQLLLSCDPRFATLRLRHAVQPAACLTMQPVLRWFLKGRLPQQRLADQMPNHLDAPQGDDFALGLLTPVSFYYAWFFPRQADVVFRHFVLMEDLREPVLDDWKRQYRRLLQKLLLESGRPRVAVRNACNTARIPHLLSAFPDARFLVCHRDPYEVFAASLERWEALTRAFSLSRDALSQTDLEELTLTWYQQLQQRYLADRAAAPAGRIFEAPYADLRERPLELMENVYTAFGLDGFDIARPLMEQFLQNHPWELAGSRPLTSQQRQTVAQHWEFAFHEWGYAM